MASAVYLFQITFVLCLSAYIHSSFTSKPTTCPGSWTSFRGSCYQFAQGGSLTFSEAAVFCSKHSGHLVHIDDQAENVFVKDYLRSMNAGETWIGLTDKTTEGLWKWYDTQTSPLFTDWYPGEPNTMNGDEDCVSVKPGTNYRWYDDSCLWHKAPLCEMTTGLHVIG